MKKIFFISANLLLKANVENTQRASSSASSWLSPLNFTFIIYKIYTLNRSLDPSLQEKHGCDFMLSWKKKSAVVHEKIVEKPYLVIFKDEAGVV